ncbi:MAG: hypothetical protein COU08_02040 [Candidatus Harrisonbacteria bacterium CG10_big_fil_rev_8_21_14_0_10_42_17]|uniref:ATP synthase F1 complex delta/epsilon subunit N-terminal domain-containing protein n=1 Tax=Candidatus Harrisonbacteria bacterium CG10_big_fil_rev_8_21_14_0_10_42_17 TaxID=1974584 RepID=A0A2M6WIC1_9BACT|nr:MAG: hypothetical protein COU08_02040 [Candidatus Harrisonbacteria bacterium CG10_big_fil_rev_8_21_14_0_10_42_17]
MALKLIIARVDKTLFDGNVESVTLPGSSGEFTVLRGHEPFVTTLKKGNITVSSGDSEQRFTITNGLVEVTSGRAVVLI